MAKSVPAHERLFSEICNKLNELGQNRSVSEGDSVNHQEKMDRLQNQILSFQTEIHSSHSELREKIKSIENVQVNQNSDMSHQLRDITEQLNNERGANSKLNADLAKSLELGLQLQLEIQGLKTKAQQIQNDERKYSNGLHEKMRTITNDLELCRALKEETETELHKAKTKFMSEQDEWVKERKNLLSSKDDDIAKLNIELEKAMGAFEGMENSAKQQGEILKSLSHAAESKIVELKMALDRKTAECSDYEGHLAQALTQAQLLKQENAGLKDYVAKMNQFLQSHEEARELPGLDA